MVRFAALLLSLGILAACGRAPGSVAEAGASSDASAEGEASEDEESSSEEDSSSDGMPGPDQAVDRPTACGECGEGELCVARYIGGACDFGDNAFYYQCLALPDACGEQPGCGDQACLDELCGPGGSCETYGCYPEMDHEFLCGVSSCNTNCDPWNPDDCLLGEKCTATSCAVAPEFPDANLCVQVMGDAMPGEPCTPGMEADDCALGSVCMDWGTRAPECVAFCQGSPQEPSCPDGFACSISYEGVLPVCLPACDPLFNSCDAAESCTYFGGSFVCTPQAESVGSYGAACESSNECAAGYACIESSAVPEDCGGAASCCSPLCDLDAMESCPGDGQSCLPYAVPPVPGYEHVGVCAIQ